MRPPARETSVASLNVVRHATTTATSAVVGYQSTLGRIDSEAPVSAWGSEDGREALLGDERRMEMVQHLSTMHSRKPEQRAKRAKASSVYYLQRCREPLSGPKNHQQKTFTTAFWWRFLFYSRWGGPYGGFHLRLTRLQLLRVYFPPFYLLVIRVRLVSFRPSVGFSLSWNNLRYFHGSGRSIRHDESGSHQAGFDCRWTVEVPIRAQSHDASSKYESCHW